MARIRQKRDANERDIVKALLDAGCSVGRLPGGSGRPDLLVGRLGRNVLLEVKVAGTGRLSSDQIAWRDGWRGQVDVVTTVDEALRVVGFAV